jgi:ABC-type Na+ efflux pump permease subunit
MRQALDIALKDLRRTYRDVPALAMMLAAPLAIALLLGAAFGGSGDFSIRPIKTIVADLDAGAATGAAGETGAAGAGPTLAQLLGDESLTSLIDLTIVSTEAEARAAVDDGTAAVAVVQPEGLRRRVMWASLGRCSPA